jgi:hypothetical protein
LFLDVTERKYLFLKMRNFTKNVYIVGMKSCVPRLWNSIYDGMSCQSTNFKVFFLIMPIILSSERIFVTLYHVTESCKGPIVQLINKKRFPHSIAIHLYGF